MSGVDYWKPLGWTEKYIGRPWTEEHDCVALVRDVLRREFGIQTQEPDDCRVDSSAALAAIRAQAVEVTDPRRGDVALMRAPRWHLGIVCGPNGDPDPYILHCLEGLGAVLTPVSNLRATGAVLKGYYRCRA